MSQERRSYSMPKSHRLGGQNAFAHVYDARTRESRGPVTVYAVPNDLPHPRLGLSVSRKVGTAVRRNRIKRRLREAFRVHQALKAKGPVTVPREFVFMDRAAIGLGAVFLHLAAELNFYRLFNEAIEGFSVDQVAARQANALAAAGL